MSREGAIPYADADPFYAAAIATAPPSAAATSITRQAVQLSKELGGKGPTKARTDWAGQDAIVVPAVGS